MAAAVAAAKQTMRCPSTDDAAAAALASAALARVCPGAAFPLLLPEDGSLRCWSGAVAVRDAAGATHDFSLRLDNLPGLVSDAGGAGHAVGAPLRDATLVAGAALASLLGDEALGALRERLRASRAVSDFLVELREAAAAALAAAPVAAAPPAAFFGALAAQLSALPSGALAEASADLSRLSLRFDDVAGRTHALRVDLPVGFPAHAPSLTADLPLPVQLTWRAGATTLADALAAASAAAARHAWLWAALDALDASAWILDPEPPAPRAACHRRVSLGGAAALWLSLDPRADVAQAMAQAGPPPFALRIYGPEHGAAPRRLRLAAALAAWSPPDDAALATGEWLPAWLQSALGEPLPPPPGAAAAAGADEAAPPECGVCYSFAWPGAPEGERGAPPGIGCDNPRCGRPFHAQCLAEWLRAQTGGADAPGGGGGRAAFGTLFGECPYCGAAIAVSPDAA